MKSYKKKSRRTRKKSYYMGGSNSPTAFAQPASSQSGSGSAWQYVQNAAGTPDVQFNSTMMNKSQSNVLSAINGMKGGSKKGGMGVIEQAALPFALVALNQVTPSFMRGRTKNGGSKKGGMGLVYAATQAALPVTLIGLQQSLRSKGFKHNKTQYFNKRKTFKR